MRVKDNSRTPENAKAFSTERESSKAQRPANESPVEMKLKNAIAKRKNADVWFDCQIVIDNETGQELEGTSHYNTGYSGSLKVVVSDVNGKEIARASKNSYLSNWSIAPIVTVLPKGRDTFELSIPIDGRLLPTNLAGVRVRVEGTLPGSPEVHSTKELEIEIQEKTK
jgi:hypothetical protein